MYCLHLTKGFVKKNLLLDRGQFTGRKKILTYKYFSWFPMLTYHVDLTEKQGKSVQYDINDFSLCRPGFHVPDISDSSRTVHIFVQVVTYRLRAA